MHIFYLHGFRSSPQSSKAQLLARHLAVHHPNLHWYCPQLPHSPAAAMSFARAWIEAKREKVAVIGSSLGGFYAAQLTNEFGVPAVLLNPAVYPARDLLPYVGEQRNWHDSGSFVFKSQYIDELRAQEPLARLGPQAAARCMAIIAKGDELLDWREMVAAYPAAQMLLLEGSDHALSDFAQYIDMVVVALTRSS